MFDPEWHGNWKSAEATPSFMLLQSTFLSVQTFIQLHPRFPKLCYKRNMEPTLTPPSLNKQAWIMSVKSTFAAPSSGSPCQDAAGRRPLGFDRFRSGGADDQHPPGPKGTFQLEESMGRIMLVLALWNSTLRMVSLCGVYINVYDWYICFCQSYSTIVML